MNTMRTLFALVLVAAMCATVFGVGDDLYVNMTLLQNATAQGAVCLDGSPPAYYLHRGFDSGLSNWIVFLDGGGWCESISDCQGRKTTENGSSKYMMNQTNFLGILHNTTKLNPDFYNWNKVWIGYCDGSSFTGDIDEVDPEKKLYFRGARIFKAVMDELWSQGMQNAKNAILSGTSAGGLATILNCDKFKFFFSSDVKVKCVANAGFFINANTISGTPNIHKKYQQVVDLHGSIKNLPPSCTSTMEPSLCFFPQNVISFIETPLFIINSAYDAWQINNTLVPSNLDPQHIWEHCKVRISNCTLNQRTTIKAFGVEFLKAFDGLTPCITRGYFITSCHTHAQIVTPEYWFSTSSPRILNKTIAEAVGDWYFDRTGLHQYMDSYPFAKDC
ncbi:hypothetical protein KY290_034331 [Solanum tuberosum]|uniref:Pectin acetylesterase n=1 Tax=Solanum tuberosum TaxID=4113 RepID=A0ABQ7U4Q5_SOLTU|nr:hypothetical protein KY284_034619 [Solanum tuberosum]KAH0741288.1 hypothetical protein KY290_034331 [Solanum tuberosum]